MPLRIALSALLVAGLAAQLLFGARALFAAFYTARGTAVQLHGDHEGARQDFHRANRTLPIEADRFRLEAAATREALGPQAAAPIYTQALRLAPYSPLLLLAAAENLMAIDHVDAARELLDRSIALTPDDWRAHHMRGLVLMKHERYPDAAREFRAASETASAFQPEVSYHLARALHATGDDAGALAEIERALEARPLSPEYHLTRGEIWLAQGQFLDARNDFSWAVESFQRRVTRGQVSPDRVIEAQALLAKTQAALDALPAQ